MIVFDLLAFVAVLLGPIAVALLGVFAGQLRDRRRG